jgi:hypothetical protein
MNYGQVEFSTSVLNVPEDVTPLKFPSWLLGEAQRIQNDCAAHSFVIIKLFLPMRIRLAHMRDDLNRLLQSIPDRFPNVHWIDVLLVENSPTQEQLHAIEQREQNCISQLSKSVEAFLNAKKKTDSDN